MTDYESVVETAPQSRDADSHENHRQLESAAAPVISLATAMKVSIPSVKSVRELAGSTRVNS